MKNLQNKLVVQHKLNKSNLKMKELVLLLVPRNELGKSVEPENFARCVPDKLIVGGRYGFLCEGT